MFSRRSYLSKFAISPVLPWLNSSSMFECGGLFSSSWTDKGEGRVEKASSPLDQNGNSKLEGARKCGCSILIFSRFAVAMLQSGLLFESHVNHLNMISVRVFSGYLFLMLTELAVSSNIL